MGLDKEILKIEATVENYDEFVHLVKAVSRKYIPGRRYNIARFERNR